MNFVVSLKVLTSRNKYIISFVQILDINGIANEYEILQDSVGEYYNYLAIYNENLF